MAQLRPSGTMAIPLAGDARRIPFAGKTIDLIVTSPPYANAIDYMRAHKFSLVWFGKSIADLSELRAEYIGSERVQRIPPVVLPDRPEATIKQLAELDSNKAAILRKYFVEMCFVFAEMYRVLRPDSAAVVVVGTSIMRNIDVQTHLCLADIAADLGFDVVGIAQRALDRNKRMMPARFGKKTDSMIEQRMHEEYVIGLLKPEAPHPLT
jgi:DNA modification methylase